MSDYHSDIVVIGAGIAGLVAAHECLERGKTVTLVDRHDEANVGGLARMAFGGMALIDTPVQRRMGVKDSPALALADWHSFAELPADDAWPMLRRDAMRQGSADTVACGFSVSGTFCDVAESAYYADAVAWMVDEGITMAAVGTGV